MKHSSVRSKRSRWPGSENSIFVLHQSDTQHRAMRRNRWLGASSRGEGARCSRSSVFFRGQFRKAVLKQSLAEAREQLNRSPQTNERTFSPVSKPRRHCSAHTIQKNGVVHAYG